MKFHCAIAGPWVGGVVAGSDYKCIVSLHQIAVILQLSVLIYHTGFYYRLGQRTRKEDRQKRCLKRLGGLTLHLDDGGMDTSAENNVAPARGALRS